MPENGASPLTESPNELDQLKGLFLASLNHEIRTPLSGILGMTDLLLETSLDEEQQEYVNAARLCAESLFEILNAALEISALEAGKFALEETVFILKEMLNAAIDLYLPRAQAKGLQLSLTVATGLPETLVGDAPRVRELLGYLLGNAIKFTHSGAVGVYVSAPSQENAARHLLVEVRDSGIGIPADRLHVIFDSFRQVENGLARSYPGLGLGLALARKLTTLMNGKIEVSSVVGQGSTFSIRLPLRQAAAPVSEIAPAQTAGDALPLILAVEDNEVGLTILRHALERLPVRADFATSGRQALDAAAARRYDLVLMDLQMPGMDGLEATVLMRKLPGYEAVPILALTANTGDDLRERCREVGMQAFLSKPIKAAELWSSISKFLRQPANL
jgi:CheY-like chemotaxis protein